MIDKIKNNLNLEGAKEAVKRPLRAVREKYRDTRSKKRIKLLSKRAPHEGKIRVGFIVQMAEIWDKEEKIYELMRRDERFKVVMLVCPAFDFVKREVRTVYDDTYFFDRYPKAVPLFCNGEWTDIRKYRLDYVFYQRPYDGYLPVQYQSSSVSAYAKCCYIPYAFWPLMNDLCGYNRDFYRNAYFAFMESEEHCKAIADREKDSRRIVYRGYPSLDGIEPEENFDTNRILWTPRWSYDDEIGGSHFFEYKDEIIKLRKEHGELDITIRPHPLAFDNYIRLGMMTEAEVEAYKQSAADAGVRFDGNKRIEDSFRDTGVLITDISSIVFPYFLTEKPIIFCSTKVDMSPAMQTVLKGMYVADSWEDVLEALREIQSGNDPMRETRHAIAEKYRLEYTDSARRIVDTLAEDYNK